ncbi:MAG: diguanylate cyclase [Gaiellales bacterium]
MAQRPEISVVRSELAESERIFRLLAETASDIVYAVGPDRIVTWVSPSIERALGWRPDEIVGTVMSALVHPEDLVWSAERRDRLYAGDPVAEAAGGFILRLATRDGAYHWVKTTLTAHRDGTGAVAGFTGGMVLVDELVHARMRVAEHEALLGLILDSMDESHILMEPQRDDQGKIVDFVHVHANRAACEEYARTPALMQGILLSELEPGVEGTGLVDIYGQVCETGEPATLEAFHYSNPVTGTDRHYDTRVVRVAGDRLSVTWRDVTDQHRAAQRLALSEQRFRLLAEHANDVIQLTRDGLLVWVSPSLGKVLGWCAEEWLHRGFDEFVHPDDLAAMVACQEQVDSGETKMIDLRVRHRDGAYHWVQVSASPFFDADGRRDGIVSSFRIVDEQVAAREALAHQARYDELTGVLKRNAVLEYLDDLDGGEEPATGSIALLFIDLDSFKAVNDSRGHAAGDLLLRAIAQRLEGGVRTQDVVARLGGDEFLVVLQDIDEPSEAVDIADHLRRVCAQPVATPAGAVATTLSVGVVVRRASESSDALIMRADQAMYAAKRTGRDQTVVDSSG